MIRLLERIAFDTERNLKDIRVAFYVYLSVFVFTFVAFVWFGILPLINSIKEKITVINEIKARTLVVNKNIVNLNKTASDLAENTLRIDYLDKYMPVGTDVQSYMLDFIQAIGTSGFSVRNFTQDASRAKNGQMDLNVNIDGLSYPVLLVKQAETLKRVTQIKRLSLYRNSRGQISINLVLTIYNYVI